VRFPISIKFLKPRVVPKDERQAAAGAVEEEDGGMAASGVAPKFGRIFAGESAGAPTLPRIA
jgi:hypothetical protein